MKHISFWKLRTLDVNAYKDDIARCDLSNDADPEKLVHLYNNTMCLLFDCMLQSHQESLISTQCSLGQ